MVIQIIGAYMDNESYFRTYQYRIQDDSWVLPANVRLFSNDFIREFKDRFKWELNTEGEVYLMLRDEKFWREITGKKKMYVDT